MKKKTQFQAAFLSILLLISLFTTTVFSETTVTAAAKEKDVQILFTHDMHSHLDPFKVNRDGEIKTVGGFAKLKTMVDQKRQENDATLLVDGGDFSMGTLYQTIYETHASELTLMGQIGYDAVTFGNHEFDYRSQGISNMLLSAKKESEKNPDLHLPLLLSANIDWEKNTSKDNQLVKAAMDAYGSIPYTILERNGIRIGLYGILGKDADACAPESGLEFEDIIQTSKQVVKELKKEKVDLILCLSHSGTFEDIEQSEDEILAKEVPEIDVIISGHSHTQLDEPIKHGNTYVVSSGSYCENLGEIDLVQRTDGRWDLKNYVLNPLDASVPENSDIKQKILSYKNVIDQNYLSKFGYTFDQILAENPVAFTPMHELGLEHGEEPLGSFIADSYIYGTKQAEGAHYEPVAAAFTPLGGIRETFQKGTITVSDAFNVCSLGIGVDRIPGYPLVSVYLTGKELKTVAEIDISISQLMPSAQLFPSGIRWTYNPNRMFLNRVTDVEFMTNVPYTAGKEKTEIDDSKLYRVVSPLYSAQMLGTVEETSMGLLKLTPKDKDGNPITDFEQHIIHDQNGTELKEWYALASYLQSFEQNENGVSEIPTYYGNTENRKELIDSLNPIELFKNPNKFAWMLYSAILLLILLITTIIRWFIKRKK